MTIDTLILATSWIPQFAFGERPARTLLVGAAVLRVRSSFGSFGFDIAANSATVTDDPAETISWLADTFTNPPARLLLWRAEDIVVPSLIAAAETARDTIAAARMLRALELAFTGEVIDVAEGYGGASAKSFDAIAHGAGIAFAPMTRADLAEAHRTGNHGDIREHLAARAKAIWQLWLAGQEEAETLIAATDAWLASPDAQVRL